MSNVAQATAAVSDPLSALALAPDVVMPGLSGPETAGHLATARPDTRVLFMSGYTDDRIAGYGILESGAPLLEKPFTSDTLARRVREVLSGPLRPLR